MNLMIRLFSLLRCITFCWTLTLVFSVSVAWAAPKPTPERAVAILFDDSGSMQFPDHPTRWVYANQALQTMIALLAENDITYWVRMNADADANDDNHITNQKTIGLNNTDKIIEEVRQTFIIRDINGGTSFNGVLSLIDELILTQADKKWLIIITDAHETNMDADYRQAHIDFLFPQLRENHINVEFVLIQPDSQAFTSAQYPGFWQSENVATLNVAQKSTDLPQVLQAIAVKLVGRDKDGVAYRQEDKTIFIDSELPLKGAVALIQNERSNLALTAAHLGSDSHPQQRFHHIQSPKNHNDVMENAYVVHLTTAKNLSGHDKTASMTFNAEISPQANIKVFPTPAVSVQTQVFSQGVEVMPSAPGRYEICQPHEANIRTSMLGQDGQVIPNDKMTVLLVNDDGGELASTVDSSGEYYVTRLTRAMLEQGITLTPHTTYPGYFDRMGTTITIEHKHCIREVTLNVLSGATNNHWRYPLDELKHASPLIFEVLVQGRAATEAEMQNFELPMPDDHPWQVEKTGNQFVLKPKSACCAFFWQRPHQIEKTQWTIKHISPLKDDKQTATLNLHYEVTKPLDKWDYYWWLLCPFALWLGLIVILWYLKRLLSKERFAKTTCIHYIRSGMSRHRSEPLVKSRLLYQIKRWFWPSRREVSVFNGLSFAAIGKRGNSIRVLGEGLDENFEIDGWVFDEVRREHGKTQLDGILYDKTTLVYYDGSGNVSYRMQYGTNRSKPVWSSDIFS